MAAKKKSKFGEKAEFVRSIPKGTPAKEVVALGKKKGIALSENYVYNVRSNKGSPKATKRKPGPQPGRRAKVAVGGMSPAEVQLRDAIADLGLVRASAILETVRTTIKGR
ncbi:MAG TPA: hypothetical protein VGC79_01900 [Polyangiaceae bacterium]